MPTSFTFAGRLSDLVQNEQDPSVGYSRESINVTPAGAMTFGKIVYRAKTSFNDADAAWTVLTATGQLVATNDFAVVFGDHYGFNESFTPNAIAAGNFNAVAFVRGNVILKEAQVYAANSTVAVDAASKELIRQALKLNGIVLETSVSITGS